MSTAATKPKIRAARDQPARPAPAKCCHRCGSIILGYVQVLELARLTHRGPECESHTLCDGCASAIRSYLHGSYSPPPAARRSP
jgi:hypothetical protein